MARTPQRIINSVAPVRICDNGGWTDTWFAHHGKIFNIAVYPYAEAQIKVYRRDPSHARVIIHAENFGQRYEAHPETPGQWDRHPLLEAAIERMGLPDDVSFEVAIFSEAPAGGGTGTSAAVTVALIGALDRLTPGQLTPGEVAATAHSIEVDMLKQQCGIQDQLASAHGGINYIEMTSYPEATVSRLEIPDPIWWELERRLALIYLGRSHVSSVLHEKVISEIQALGPDCRKLEVLRQTAQKSRDAVLLGHFSELGAAMRENTEAQAALHPELVSAKARRVIAIAREYGALGWKVNGAGGEGGSLTLLAGPESGRRRAMIREIEQEDPAFRFVPTYLARHGLRVWVNEEDEGG